MPSTPFSTGLLTSLPCGISDKLCVTFDALLFALAIRILAAGNRLRKNRILLKSKHIFITPFSTRPRGRIRSVCFFR